MYHGLETTMDAVEEGKGLLEKATSNPNSWRNRFDGSPYRTRNYNTSKDDRKYSTNDIVFEAQKKHDTMPTSQSIPNMKHKNSSGVKYLDSWSKNVWKSSLGVFNFSKQSGSGHKRVMDRDAPFHQSYGRWNIKRRMLSTYGVPELFSQDRFHSLLNKSTLEILALIFGLYIVSVALFAIAYRLISNFLDCNLDISNMVQAYFFSLETMTTVGYGTKDQFFGGCYSVLIITIAQACFGLLLDAILIGVLFTRLSRPSTRASTVVFSDFAVIRRVRGEFYFMFQVKSSTNGLYVGELRKHQLLEAHVRCYAIRHDRTLPMDSNGKLKESCKPETVHYQTHCMRIQHPNDELGSQLLLVIPQIIVHRIEAWSPLMPPPRWVSEHGIVTWGIHSDTDHIQAPWDVNCDDYSSTASLDHSPFHGPKPAILRKQSTYWAEHPINLDKRWDSNRGLGYVYRFPDLQKRWDDVDGERGTWYEKMKIRVTLMEEARLARKAEMELLETPNIDKPVSITNLTKDGDTVPLSKYSKSTHHSAMPLERQKKGDEDERISTNEWFAKEEKGAIQAYILDRELEILIILEGIDTTTGCTVQCRHSYSVENILWDHAIAPCVEKDEDGFCTVDYEKFHDVRPAPRDCHDAGFVQSYA